MRLVKSLLDFILSVLIVLLTILVLPFKALVDFIWNLRWPE